MIKPLPEREVNAASRAIVDKINEIIAAYNESERLANAPRTDFTGEAKKINER
jgi:hypothetical protein